MAMRDTSLDAYDKVKKNLGKRQAEVLQAIKDLKFATNTQISEHLNLPINCITGRTRELFLRKKIEAYYVDTCPITGNKATFWRAI